ncbi:Beta-ketoacyl-(acyl-carrier-protein) synthase I [Citrus sinensis]|uniref:Beta-ketoacyl-(Acyl-carrier-protein) synthase I n=1 Tax=Citrus sinensis TaxID=2711 RepID=A0ACB8J867_CITSI|nr:Beta-ketoacyl-(acyl-carrier-protein) synthase I [Citrus sinensis]
METASLASPLCTSPAANYGNYHPLKSSMLKSPKRHKKLTSRCNIGSTFCIRNGFSRKTMAVSAAQSEKDFVITKKKETGERRIVVTGLGAVTPLGDDAHLFHTSLFEGVTGISDIQGFDCSEFPTRIAAEIKSLSTDGWISPKIVKKADKYLIYALVAGKKALVDAGITEQVSGELDKSRCGVIIGSAMGGLRGSTGPSYSISTACASSNYSILDAASHMIKGDTDIMLCGGSDGMIIPSGIAGLIACNALSQRNSDPTKAARPWDKRRTNIYAEILGGSLTCDAYHITAPHPEVVGMVSCMKKALAQAGVAREDVNYINAHAPSTRLAKNELYKILDWPPYLELQVQRKLLPQSRVLATIIEALRIDRGYIYNMEALLAIQTGWIHPNLNLENPDKHVDAKVLVRDGNGEGRGGEGTDLPVPIPDILRMFPSSPRPRQNYLRESPSPSRIITGDPRESPISE